MTLDITVREAERALSVPFVISNHRWESLSCIQVEARQDGATGRGEAVPIYYRPETAEGLCAQIETVARQVDRFDRRDLLAGLLPANGARSALDAALWDLEAKLSGMPVWRRAGLTEAPRPVVTVMTVSLDEPASMAEAAARHAKRFKAIKLKLGAEGDDERLRAIRAAAPHVRLVVDANQGWSEAELERLTPALIEARIEMVEQPLPAGADGSLDGYDGPLTLCADESFQTLEDLERCARDYAMVNIKLDKCGGLTAGLAIARLAGRLDLKVMVGNMLGGSLAMAPAHLVGQFAALCDLDGPLSLVEDDAHGMRFEDGLAYPPEPALWG